MLEKGFLGFARHVIVVHYISCYDTLHKSWDTLHIFNLDEKFVHLLPLNNVGYWEKHMR